MCIAIWSTNNQLGYRLILAFNRDEFLNRPSLPAHWHSFEQLNPEYQAFPPVPCSSSPTSSSPSTTSKGSTNKAQDCVSVGRHINQKDQRKENDILSGIDTVTGATWLGISKHSGKFAFLTNVETQADRDQEAVHSKKLSFKLSRGYNLIIGQIGRTGNEEDQIEFFCNKDPEGLYGADLSNNKECGGRLEDQRVYGISNGIANQAPILPKVAHGVHLMEDCLSRLTVTGEKCDQVDQSAVEMSLFNLLSQVTNDSPKDTSSNILIRPHHRLMTPDTPISSDTWCGTKTQTILFASKSPKTRITLVERDAFQIQPKEPSTNTHPVWLGDDMSHWRRFEFDLTSDS
ncbi:hypothetical protein PTTG_08933 [Puccinia triticina 1-1 BBBD Race 1]|uniref:DUF833-domain-containing protein n=2 Tax=Puccinia triticina TaxID=208348 RepID=A0A0C4F706_PUCT1|nr:uncharacterized protein PtA15_6A349 [Puccinia triticina]OAV96908.1 hypothetical protein PTTG_08933 [Puccinia triticina 1-1 BBBD Race 1]WAQ85720.1 hypothetical protein PtA15_6A349 [Puccinia triticina]WAR55595.1 hypothetical protein PtB15_6B338 [Puccinia triticina]